MAVNEASPRELPHNHEAILQMAELHSVEDLHEHFRAGVFLNNKTTRFWTEPSTNYNSFMLYARALTIAKGEDPKFWRWPWLEGDIDVEVAELLEVCPLAVNGSFEMNHFTPKTKYEVLFVMMMKNLYEVEPHVTLTLELPSGKKLEKKLSLHEMAPNQWAEVKVGEFVATSEEGDIKFSLMSDEEADWEKGLIVEGVLIQPCP